ncbi:SbcC/MukB-like Walker B domain-containing protein [Curtobacterium sp. MCLR17_007]|uniref:ATP-binding protein n=1 Tax=Curtobacterium sp. MCLR17_007 TaxID=2175648 RepID=UPI000DA877EE|nr:SbcC/MukB-like Walker B domain-containing protein [Curtobacterium sp. MCLR17_007]WIB61906.1 SbcC/MukB-like Walker B domain-containing protein [Curtobacterium sp. MCLR17_007]
MTDRRIDTAGMPALFDTVAQWRAQSMQVVNWGGFHGHRQIELSGAATLISGASGTGKSTLMDAYLAVMMPSDVPFNGASNDATTGRARSADQRNLLTYLRGKIDTRRDPESGSLRDVNLRGDDTATWGAVAVTFLNDDERRFTVLRAYIVPKRARGVGDIQMTMATVDDDFDLRRLEAFVPSRFSHLELTGRVPGLVIRDTYQELAYTLQTRLGIGDSGGGNRAMRLLARIQAGQHMPTVDSLYKSLVLETPGTYEAADRALAHFSALDEAYEAMDTEERKVRILAPITELHLEIERSRAAAAALDGIATGSEVSPFAHWTATRKRALLDDEVDRNRRSRTAARAEVEAASARHAAVEIELREAEARLRDSGGNALAQLEDRIERRTRERAAVERTRTAFDDRTAALGTFTTESAFVAGQRASHEFLGTHAAARAALDDRRDALTREEYPLLDRERSLRQERQSLEHRQGAMPLPMHEARVAMAQAAGMDPASVPFVAELLDVLPGEERWRTAIESVLAPVARTLLVDQDQLDTFSAAIDALRIPVRVQFEGVPSGPHLDVDGDRAMVSGKLAVKDSPFSTWVRSRIESDRIDARCVSSASELGGGGRRVTESGQLRDGRRGAHGDRRQANVIGFTNESRVVAVEQELAAIAEDLATLEARRTDVAQDITALDELRAAHQHLVDTTWDAIDLTGADESLARLSTERDALLAADDGLRALRTSVARLRTALDDAADRRAAARLSVQRLEERHAVLVDGQDAAAEILARFDDSPALLPDEQQAQLLAETFDEVGAPDGVDGFDDATRRLRRRLEERLSQALDGAASASNALTMTFQRYQDAWPDPNLGTGVASYPDYRAILDDIVATGLHARRSEWRRRLSQWSGEDLVPLAGAFDRAVVEIEERLEPVNEILRDLPFGANRDRLKIVIRRVTREDVTQFRRELRALSASVDTELTDDVLETRFRRLRRFMAVIRHDGSMHRGARTSQRDAVLDVRRHMEITAVRYDTTGTDLGVYSSLGDKSGGETQELVAFIVGAALRYQLGDETRPRPRFAPVFLDEAFIKADSEFAGRAVTAWLRLGFQLVVSAPLDKVTALEPSMERLLSMRKHPDTGHSSITEIRRAEPAAAAAVAPA